MKDLHRILFVSQEIYPYLPEESPIRMLNRRLPEFFQANGYETRTFMPKFGDINERRNQLHEVIRLSGMNLIIDDSDHPLLLKVASIPAARVQVYFVDNDDYFQHRKGVRDEQGVEYKDNDERSIFFARGALETVQKLRWTPEIVHCSGWMAALVPLYIRKAYAGSPFFEHAKVVLSLDNDEYKTPFGTKFAEKIMVEGILQNDLRTIDGFPVGYEELMRLAIDHADAITISSPDVNQRLINYAEMRGKAILGYQENEPQAYLDFYNSLLTK